MPRGQRLGNSLEVGLACWALPSSPRETHAGPAPAPGGETQGAETCAKPSWNRPTRRCANCLDASCYMSAGFCAGCRVIVWPRVADHFYSQRGFLLENAAGTQAWTPRCFPFLRSFFPPSFFPPSFLLPSFFPPSFQRVSCLARCGCYYTGHCDASPAAGKAPTRCGLGLGLEGPQ